MRAGTVELEVRAGTVVVVLLVAALVPRRWYIATRWYIGGNEVGECGW